MQITYIKHPFPSRTYTSVFCAAIKTSGTQFRSHTSYYSKNDDTFDRIPLAFCFTYMMTQILLNLSAHISPGLYSGSREKTLLNPTYPQIAIQTLHSLILPYDSQNTLCGHVVGAFVYVGD